MKKTLITLFLLCLFSTSVFTQTFTGNLTLTTQAEIDTLNYTSVTGNLTIQEAVPGGITNLNGLSELTSVGGIFEIANNSITNVDGLLSLNIVTQMLSVTGNNSLINIDGLQNLYYAEIISIRGNNSLTNLDGLSGIGSIVTGMEIHFNNVLTDISGLSNLTYAFSLSFDSNPLVTNLDALSNLTFVGTLNVAHMSGLTSIDGLSNTIIGNYLKIDDVDNLTDLDALSNVDTTLTGLEILNNEMLTNINGLLNLTSVSDFLIIRNNTALNNLIGLSNLASVDGELVISGNSSLMNVGGLNNLTQAQRLEISNSRFVNLVGFGNLHTLTYLIINDNDSLINLDGLAGLTTAGYSIDIMNNAILSNIDSLINISSVGAIINILYNDSLDEFCGLYNIINNGFPGSGQTLNISNNASNPIRGQILLNCGSPSMSRSFIAVLKGENEVPPVETDATGGGMFILNASQDTLHYWIRVCDLVCPFTAAHFHSGDSATSGPVVKTITSDFVEDSTGSLFAHGIWTSSDPQPLNSEIVSELIKGNIYVNIHTTTHPSGEIRGQLTSDVPVHLYANLNGTQEVPPASTTGSGEGHFILSGDGDSLYYEVTVQGLSGNISAAHFHKAPAGVAGGVVKPISFSNDTTSIGFWTNTDTASLTPELVADLLSCFIYVNVHTPNYPMGEIRGQIYKMEDVFTDRVTGVTQSAGIPAEYKLNQNYPNPFNPSTSIRYSLPENQFVKLNIYNSLGEAVKTLVNENLSAGEYETVFDASGLPSGMYIYRIEAGSYVSSGKMILMK